MITTAVRTRQTAVAPSAPRTAYNPAALFRVVVFTLGAAAIHFAVAPEHLREYLPFGLFLLLCGAAQVGLAVLTVLRPSRQLFAAGALGTLAVLALWLLSRTAGLPIGPTPGQPEAVGQPDTICAILETLAVIQFGLLARGPRPIRRSGRKIWRIVRAGFKGLGMTLVMLLVSFVSTFAVLAGLSPMPDDVNMSAPPAGGPALSILSLRAKPGPEPVKSFTLTAQVASINGQAAWTYNGTVPGPELRVTQGDRVRMTLVNHLPESTSIHWHGLALPNADDGVAGVTQDAVKPGASYTYEFVVNDPGTYWYHSHQDTLDQVTHGLYGALVVEPQGPAAYDRDYAVALGQLGDQLAVNGRTGELHLDAQPGDLVRLRLINAAETDMTAAPERFVLLGAPYQVVALDGHDLHGPQPLGLQILPLGAGQRYDLAFRMPASGQVWLLNTAADTRPGAGAMIAPHTPAWMKLAKLLGDPAGVTTESESITLGSGPAPTVPDFATLPAFDLTTYGTPAPDPLLARTSFDVDQQITISDDHGFRDGMFEFIFMLNGAASPNVPPIVVQEGQVVRLRFVNNSDFYHPMHLHGHVFTVLSKNGHPLTGSPVHSDSVLVGPRETWEVAFVANNPGLWMLHCHSMVHAAWGLSMMLDYSGYSTPFDMGTQSGNIPE